MSESRALAVITPEEQAYLDSLETSAGTANSNGPTQLVINGVSKDADGNKRVIGSWHLKGTDKYYDGAIKFRPVRHADKLIRYTSTDGGKTWDFKGQSVYFTDYREEIIDSLGGLALGRKFGKELRAMSVEAQEANRKLAGTYKDIFGFVTFGDAEPEPCVLRVRGGKYKAFLDAFDSIPKDKRYSQYNYDLETYQETDDKTKKVKEYWSIKVSPDMSQALPITPILAFDAEVMEFIRENNHQVLEAHKKARNQSQDNSGDSAKVINAAPVRNVMFDDELPF